MLIAARVFLTLLGASIIPIGLMLAVLGPDTTAKLFGDILGTITRAPAYSGGFDHVNADSEMRVLAIYFAAYGAVILWLSARLESHSRWVYCAIALYFAGGATRLFSLASAGWPDPLLTYLMAIELGTPILIACLLTLGLRAKT
ncbi:DUF4345 domain-containing protein [Roseovarius aestuarii]|nr:DUF4345 domain-containing protein [Roseovarius aestuarii]